MTVRIPVPLGPIATVLLVAVAWGGAAGVALALDYWLDDEGVGRSELADYVTASDLDTYATDSELAGLRGEISSIRAEQRAAVSRPDLSWGRLRLNLAVALLVLNAAAQGELRSYEVKTTFFADADPSDYETCIDWLAGRSGQELTGREACGRVGAASDFAR